MAEGMFRCLAHGDGSWHFSNRSRPRYTLSPTFMPGWEKSLWWWGCEGACCKKGCATCFHDKHSVRPELLWDWKPEGDGCDALPAASFDQLRVAFCDKFAGRSILFVGDSIQGQFFSSFAHQVGYVDSKVGANSCCKMMLGGGAHECDVTATLCSKAKGRGVRVRYLRNAYLYLEKVTNAAGRHLGNPNCDWIDEARPVSEGGVDRIVLASGMHVRAGVEAIGLRLNSTFRQLAALSDTTAAGAPSAPPLASRVIYRSIHSPMYNCTMLPDPMTRSQADAYQQHMAQQVQADRYNWSKFARMEEIAKASLAPWQVPYLDVYRASSMRPGGYNLLRPRGSRSAVVDCGHYCLPGPLDDWSRLLLIALMHNGP